MRLHGLIERIPGTHRYHVTQRGLRVALLFTRTYDRLLRPGLAQLDHVEPPAAAPLRVAFQRLEAAIDDNITRSRLAA